MNVKRATDVFSPIVTATLHFLKDNPNCHPSAAMFSTSHATIEFMEVIYKWYELHDVSNREEHLRTLQHNRRPFESITDERLEWLKMDFLVYMEEMRDACQRSHLKFLTKETYEATYLTTLSTIDTVIYLLNDVKFRYVLTRRFNSDSVESLFICFRQFKGGNDKLDARTAVLTAEKILKVGILQAAKHGNAPSSFESTVTLPSSSRSIPKEGLHESDSSLLNLTVDFALKLQSVPENVPSTIENASLASMAGYLVRVIEEKIDCFECQELVSRPQSHSTLFGLISNQDRGHLRYPTEIFVSVLLIVLQFVSSSLQNINVEQKGVRSRIENAILPHLQQCKALCCKNQCEHKELAHSKHLCKVIMAKFVKPILSNWAGRMNLTVERILYLQHKPTSRKVLKL